MVLITSLGLSLDCDIFHHVSPRVLVLVSSWLIPILPGSGDFLCLFVLGSEVNTQGLNRKKLVFCLQITIARSLGIMIT